MPAHRHDRAAVRHIELIWVGHVLVRVRHVTKGALTGAVGDSHMSIGWLRLLIWQSQRQSVRVDQAGRSGP